MSAIHLGLSRIMQPTYLPNLVSCLLPLIRIGNLQYYNMLDDSLITISPWCTILKACRIWLQYWYFAFLDAEIVDAFWTNPMACFSYRINLHFCAGIHLLVGISWMHSHFTYFRSCWIHESRHCIFTVDVCLQRKL